MGSFDDVPPREVYVFRDGDGQVRLTAPGLLRLAEREPDPTRRERLRLLATLRKVAAIRRLRERGVI